MTNCGTYSGREAANFLHRIVRRVTCLNLLRIMQVIFLFQDQQRAPGEHLA
jgi:hypothetical protein